MPVATKPYIIPCASAFRDAVLALAEQKSAQPGDLIKAVILTVGSDRIADHPDPGEPAAGDREEVTLQSGAQEGRVLRRKPRLQLRLSGNHDVVFLRKALGVALSLAGRSLVMDLRAGAAPAPEKRIAALEEQVAELRQVLDLVAFPPLASGVSNQGEALYVLGFAPGQRPELAEIRRRFKQLAQALHPDRPWGDKLRMGQLLDARKLLESFR
jgi:hypothetical protein